MRSWLLIALSIATQFSAFANEGTAQKNGGKQKEGIITRVGQEKADKGNRREFQIDFEFSMEQQDKNGDLAVEGKTIPGSTTTRTETTLDLSDGQLLPLPAVSGNESTSFEIKITSLENDMVRLAVSAKQSRKVSIEAGESRSWNLKFEATKIVKLGKEIKIEFGDEKKLGTKCVFEGLIEEKAKTK